MDFKIKELDNNYDPIKVFSIFEDMQDTAFLDGKHLDKTLSQYSFIGINPILKFKFENNIIVINDQKLEDNNPFLALEKLTNNYKIKYDSQLPFIGGAIGYLSYDINSNKKSSIPKSIFCIYENLIIFDLINKKTYISALGIKKHKDTSIEEIEQKITNYKGEKVDSKIVMPLNNQFYTNLNNKEYKKAICKIKKYIQEGDIYIANMTRQIWCKNNQDAFSIYKNLREINQAPFSAFINFKEFQIISASPERFLSIKEGIVNTRPIKGTLPRGKSLEEDEKNKHELMNSEKDKSELLMIVDLERNDLSKVCEPHSVKVTELFKIEKYATVFHLIANIKGKLEKNTSAIRCMQECFPGGSITGAPKKRAMEIIDELEQVNREIYTGSIGYFDFRGNCDFNIVIRSIIKKGDSAFFGVGGGITWESDEESEWIETTHKAAALIKVLS